MSHEGSIIISGVRYSRFFEIRLYSISILILVWIRGNSACGIFYIVIWAIETLTHLSSAFIMNTSTTQHLAIILPVLRLLAYQEILRLHRSIARKKSFCERLFNISVISYSTVPSPESSPNGRVLLVGYMGMYDYRPYVKKVTNNRQIMYECHRHYTLVEGPPGATCVDGQWSPKQMPRCVRGSHPVLTTQRRRRELMRNRLRRGREEEEEEGQGGPQQGQDPQRIVHPARDGLLGGGDRADGAGERVPPPRHRHQRVVQCGLPAQRPQPHR
ncbi:protein lev-9 [Caerostris extrusa]|uniref:Protein lev-9 n=1 Tax=Caerostris extrusa TaxID=172846 RepID=A0AAV4WI03_CAEEX|nr:protein lev-9 [Caerostris extrusa]